MNKAEQVEGALLGMDPELYEEVQHLVQCVRDSWDDPDDPLPSLPELTLDALVDIASDPDKYPRSLRLRAAKAWGVEEILGVGKPPRFGQ